MSPSRLLNVLRTTFLVSALGFGVMTAFWPKIYPSLSKLDWGLVKLYTRDAHTAFEDAKIQLEGGEAAPALESLAEIAADLEGIRRGDRLSPLRTSVLDLLAETHQAQGQLDVSLEWTEKLLAYDERDFVSMLRRAELLESLGRGDAAFEQMQAAFLVGATSGPARVKYVEMLCERGLRTELAEMLLGLGLRGPLYVPMRDWEFRWCVDTRKDFRPKVPLELASHGARGQFGAAISIPGQSLTVRGLRIDLPGGSLVSLGKVTCEVLTKDGVAVTLTEQDIVHSTHFVEDGDGLATTGDVDPFVILYRPDMEAVSGVVGFNVSVEAGPKLPAEAKALLAGGFDPKLRSAWSARYGEAAVLALESIQ